MLALILVLACMSCLMPVNEGKDWARSDDNFSTCTQQLHHVYMRICLGLVEPATAFGKRAFTLQTVPAFDALSHYDRRLENDHEGWPWLESGIAHKLFPTHAVKRHSSFGGLVDECCEKPCYIEDILKYCPDN